MVDTNAPAAWRVIDTQEPRAIVGQYATLREAVMLCDELEPDTPFTGRLRFITEPVRGSEIPSTDGKTR